MPAVLGRTGFGRRGWGSGPYGQMVPAGGEAVEVDPKIIQRLRKQQQLVQIIKDDEEISALLMLATMRGS
jgi:hypothetical protein